MCLPTTPVFTNIFNLSLTACKIPSYFESAVNQLYQFLRNTTSAVLQASGFNVCYNESVQEVGQQTSLYYRCKPVLFAYRANRSVDDAVSSCLHYIQKHPEESATYAQVLFVSCRSAFNTIYPERLFDKLHYSMLGVSRGPCHWILDFLSNRTQVVKFKNMVFKPSILNSGAPSDDVLSPLLCSVYTNDCTSNSNCPSDRKMLMTPQLLAYLRQQIICIYSYTVTVNVSKT